MAFGAAGNWSFTRADPVCLLDKKGKRRIRRHIARIAPAIIFACLGLASRAAQPVGPDPDLLAGQPWEYGAFVNGGFGTGNRADYKFFWAGLHAGKVLTGPMGKGC